MPALQANEPTKGAASQRAHERRCKSTSPRKALQVYECTKGAITSSRKWLQLYEFTGDSQAQSIRGEGLCSPLVKLKSIKLVKLKRIKLVKLKSISRDRNIFDGERLRSNRCGLR